MKQPGRSAAFLASLLLHGTLLLGLGRGTVPARGPERVLLSVSLVMPAAVQERAPGSFPDPEKNAFHAKSTAGKPPGSGPARLSRQDPVVGPSPKAGETGATVTQRPATRTLAEEDRVPETPRLAADRRDPPGPVVPADPEPSDELPVNADGIGSAPRDPDPAVGMAGGTMLAFAGDPAALAMITRDHPGLERTEARVLFLPEPKYPHLSRKWGEEGRVVLEVELGARGNVLGARVVESSSYARLDRAALEAVKEAAYSPAVEEGTPVSSKARVAYRFELEN